MTQATKLRAIIIDKLGAKCAQCGNNDPVVLEIDHINNDGNKHRKEKDHYHILKDWASGIDLDRIQLLCANCHRRKMSGENIKLLQRNSNIKYKTLTKLELREKLRHIKSERITSSQQTTKERKQKEFLEQHNATIEAAVDEIVNKSNNSLLT